MQNRTVQFPEINAQPLPMLEIIPLLNINIYTTHFIHEKDTTQTTCRHQTLAMLRLFLLLLSNDAHAQMLTIILRPLLDFAHTITKQHRWGFSSHY